MITIVIIQRTSRELIPCEADVGHDGIDLADFLGPAALTSFFSLSLSIYMYIYIYIYIYT